MIRRAFLEKIEKEWLDDFVYICRQPLVDLGFDVVSFDGTNLKSLEALNPTRNDMVVGSVEATSLFFNLVGIETPEYIGYPECLQNYLKRSILKTTIKDLKTKPHIQPFDLKTKSHSYFIKPTTGVKRFTGSVIRNIKNLENLISFDSLHDDEEVYVSDLISIESEYRCFVHDGKLKGIQHYSGDFKKFPNINMIEFMIIDYEGSRESPISYTLDVGILSNGSTALIEVNDMWAIGSYGLSGKIYARMAVDRFYQITNKDNGKS